MRSLRTSALLSLLLVVGLIAGCGGGDDSTSSTPSGSSGASGASGSASTASSTSDYSKQVDGVLSTFNQAYSTSTKAAGNPSSAADYLKSVTATQDAVKTAASDLQAIEPPADAADFNDELVSAFSGLDSGLDPLISAAKDASNGNPQALKSAATDFATTTGDFVKTVTKLGTQAQQQGLDIPSLAG